MAEIKPATEYVFDGFKTGGMRAVSTEGQVADISDYVPLLDYVLVKTDTGEKLTKGGLILPDQVQEDPVEGEVVAAGPGNHQNGVWIPNRVSVGMYVRFGKWASGNERKLRVGESVYLLMREEDCILTRPSKQQAVLKKIRVLDKRTGVREVNAKVKDGTAVFQEGAHLYTAEFRHAANLYEITKIDPIY